MLGHTGLELVKCVFICDCKESLSLLCTSHSPWYRTVLRGIGFQLRPIDFSHPTRNTSSKSFVPPMAPVCAPIRWTWRCAMDPVINQSMRRPAGERKKKNTSTAIHSPYWLRCSSQTIPSEQHYKLHILQKAVRNAAHAFQLHRKRDLSPQKKTPTIKVTLPSNATLK